MLIPAVGLESFQSSHDIRENKVTYWSEDAHPALPTSTE
jgi:hypothetical protein